MRKRIKMSTSCLEWISGWLAGGKTTESSTYRTSRGTSWSRDPWDSAWPLPPRRFYDLWKDQNKQSKCFRALHPCGWFCICCGDTPSLAESFQWRGRDRMWLLRTNEISKGIEEVNKHERGLLRWFIMRRHADTHLLDYWFYLFNS